MAAGKLILLLVAGGLAGAAFAGLTTRGLHSFEQPARAAVHDDRAYAGPPARSSSWLDQGLSALDSPAWPFGRGGWSEEPAPEPAPYDYGAPGSAGGQVGPGGEYGPGGFDDGDDYQAGPPEQDPYMQAPDLQPPDPGEDTPRIAGQDAASAAARRAADAAKDVTAAENDP